jgi:hypothetical protein
MSTINAELQIGVFNLLDGAVSIDGGANFLPVYDAVPQTADSENVPLYVTIGDSILNPFDASPSDTLDNQRAVLTIHSWTKDYEGRLQVKKIMDAVGTLMNRGNLALTSYTVVLMRVLSNNTLRDPDGNTWHGVQTVDVIINSN